MEDWKTVSIGELCDSVSITYSRNDSEVILINTSDVLDGKVLNHTKVENKNLKGQFKKTFKKDDILYSEIRPANKRFAFIDFDDTEEYIASTKLMVLRPKKELVEPRFLFAILKSWQVIEELQHLAETRSGTFPQITFNSELAPMKVKLPCFEVQRKIVSILTSIEEKIDINLKVNENIENQGKTLFKSWFVDFEPFQSEDFIKSPIDTLIPKSLEMIQIMDMPHILESGKRPKGGAVEKGVPSIGAESVKKLGEFDISSAKFVPEEFAAKMSKGEIHGYELLIYKDGGKPGTFTPHYSMFGEGFPYDKLFINEHVFKLDFFDKGINEFAYYYFQTDYVVNWLAHNGGKAAVPGINQQDVKSVYMYNTNHPKIIEFANWIQPMFTRILSNCAENQKLTQLRDAILPKLMSGDIDVSDL